MYLVGMMNVSRVKFGRPETPPTKMDSIATKVHPACNPGYQDLRAFYDYHLDKIFPFSFNFRETFGLFLPQVSSPTTKRNRPGFQSLLHVVNLSFRNKKTPSQAI